MAIGTQIMTKEEAAQNLVYRGIMYETLSSVIHDLRAMKTQSTDVPPAYKEGWNEALDVAMRKILRQADDLLGFQQE